MELGRDVRLFDRFARLYDYTNPATEDFAVPFGLAGRDVERILDVGGGTGRGARAVDAPERVVMDASRGMLRQARGRGLDAVQADAARLPVADGTVDAVVVVDALHHFADAEAAVAEAARVLRPGGVLVVRDFDAGTLRGRLLAAFEHAVGFESTFYAMADLADVVESAGLEASRLRPGFGFTLVGIESGES